MVKTVKNLLLGHFYIDIVLFITSACFLLIEWHSLSVDHRLAYALFLGMCLHQLEEYRFPGGFIWGFNKVFMNSDLPDRYPSTRLSAVLVDVISMVVAAPFLYWHYSTILGACFAIFALLEVVGHLLFGILAFKKYHKQGKETIYFPGSFTSWIFFAPFSIVLLFEQITSGLTNGHFWLWTVIILIIFMAVDVVLPTLLFSKRDTPYIYDEEPREGLYFKKFNHTGN